MSGCYKSHPKALLEHELRNEALLREAFPIKEAWRRHVRLGLQAQVPRQPDGPLEHIKRERARAVERGEHAGELGRVRITGVDTPEVYPKSRTEAFGPEASEFARVLLFGRYVRHSEQKALARSHLYLTVASVPRQLFQP